MTVVSTVSTGGIDLDGDGLPDAWERKYGLNPAVPEGELDADGDGFSNRDEYLAGTDPVRDQSRLFSTVEVVEDSVTVRFQAEPGRSYTLQRRDTLGLGSWQNVQVVPAAVSPRDLRLTDSRSESAVTRWYRISTP